MENIYRCYQCRKEISEKSMLSIFGKYMRPTLEHSKKRLFCCDACYQQYLKERQVDEYNGIPIYKRIINGKEYYVPYVECTYAFQSIEDCKKRMSMSNVAVVDSEILKNCTIK